MSIKKKIAVWQRDSGTMSLCVLVLFSFTLAGSLWAQCVDFGPFYYKGFDVNGKAQITAAGPIFEKRTDINTNNFFAVRPFYSLVSSEQENKSEKNVLWPVWIGSEKDKDYEWKLLYLVFWNDFDKYNEHSKYHFWMLPIYFQGRTEQAKSYVGLFPVLGKIYDLLGQDEISFCLFPLYSRRKVNDVETYNFIWPIFSSTRGEGIRRHRAFPIYGYSRLRSDYEKYFVLWPIWSYATYYYPDSSGYGYIFFPVFGRTRVQTENTIFVVPPFFRYTKGKKQNMENTPWPVFQFASGKTNRKYFWPICGKRDRGSDSYFFALWPLYHSWSSSNDFYISQKRMFIPFYYAGANKCCSSNTAKFSGITNQASFKLWPVVSWKQQDKKEQTRILSLFPFKDFEAIDKNYAPFWTIYLSEKNDDEIDRSVLWGIVRWRYEKNSGEKYFSLFPLFNCARGERSEFSWSFLKGFAGREYKGEKAYIKLLYFFSF
jgi:hypothetical protein